MYCGKEVRQTTMVFKDMQLKIAFRTKNTIILWHNRPMREVIEIRNLKECDCTTVAERRHVLPPLPSSLFAPRVARLRGNYLVAQQ
jgi:hypothetical protein